MIGPVDVDEGRRLAKTHRCAEPGCNGQLSVAWQGVPPPDWGKGEYVLRCGKNPEHSTIQPASRTRQLYDYQKGWVEVEILTQRQVGIPGALAVPQTGEAMLERANQTLHAGLWPQTMTPNQKDLMIQVALAYGLDPLMGELVLYQGKPLITMNARRRKDAEAGHHPSIRFRFLTADEKQGYSEAGAINEGDLVQVAILTTEWGNTVESIGKVTRAEREASSERSRDSRRLAHPILADNPIEMCQKRAEARARLMAYGPIPLPQTPGITVSEISASGTTIEGELLNPAQAAEIGQPDSPALREGRDLARDIDEIFPNDDPFDSGQAPPGAADVFDPNQEPPPMLPAHVTVRTHLEAVLKEQRWDIARLQNEVLAMPLSNYLHTHSLDQAYQAWKAHVVK